MAKIPVTEICPVCLGCTRHTMPNGGWIRCEKCKGTGVVIVQEDKLMEDLLDEARETEAA